MQDTWDTPLHKAAWEGHKEVIALLLEANADVNAFNKVGSRRCT